MTSDKPFMPSVMVGMHQGEELLVLQLGVHHGLVARAVEFFILILLGVEGMNDIDAGQIFPGHPVDACPSASAQCGSAERTMTMISTIVSQQSARQSRR